MVPFPVPSGSYRDLAVVKDGVVWIEVADRGGELGATRAGVTGEAPSDVLWHYNLSARHLDKLCERVDTFSVAMVSVSWCAIATTPSSFLHLTRLMTTIRLTSAST